MADQQQMIEEFRAVTGADAERSRFYLEAANWELHVALSSFYDEDGMGASDDAPQEQPAPMEAARDTGARSSRSGFQRVGNIATLQPDAESESDDDADEGQAFYAGGSETSGQQILGPSKKKNKADNITKKIFEAAKKQGAEPVEEEEEKSKQKQKQYFGGAGFRLGSEETDSQQVTPSLSGQESGDKEPVRVQLKFWSNGFSLDDGPLRSFDDPSNRALLNSVEKGEIPRELIPGGHGNEVHVNIEDRRQEEYIKPKLNVPAFSGKGRMLGSPAQDLGESPVISSASPSRTGPPPELNIDESKPTTTLQIRLADGTRLVSKFNHSNTVGDIRNLVLRARPNTGENFVLMTTFPNKELTEESKTLVDANLLNAVIVQRKR